ncbi:MAG: DUF6485 family protein [Thermoguttaceae bacterium]
MECKVNENSKKCTCSYTSCSRRGVCCDCISSHLAKRQLPGCVFSKEAEATYDRSFEHFARLVQEKKV